MAAARAALPLAIVALVLAAFPIVRTRPEPPEEIQRYVPGLGEIMTAVQMRHAKLGVAGAAGNWELVDYELDELDEGLEDAALYHPTHKDMKQPLTEMIPAFMNGPLDALREAAKTKDVDKFDMGFDALTTGCNGCHQAADFGFNVVTKPTAAPVPNQQFDPPQ